MHVLCQLMASFSLSEPHSWGRSRRPRGVHRRPGLRDRGEAERLSGGGTGPTARPRLCQAVYGGGPGSDRHLPELQTRQEFRGSAPHRVRV